MDNSDQVIDGELVSSAASASPANQADIALEMERLIKSHVASIERLKDELDKNKSMLDAIFENDPTYKDHSEKAKEAAKVKSGTKLQILKQPQAADLDSKVKSMRSQIKETQGALSDYLREYQRISGLTEIEGEDGEIREIIYTAKLVKRSSRG